VPAARADLLYGVTTYFPSVSFGLDTPEAFTFTEPTFLSSTTTIPVADLTIIEPPVGCTLHSVTIEDPDSPDPSITQNLGGCKFISSSVGLPGPLNQDGSYNNGAPEPSILTISGTPVAAVPEPGSGVLLLALTSIVVLLRKRNPEVRRRNLGGARLAPNPDTWKSVDQSASA